MDKILHILLFSENPDKDTFLSENLQKSSELSFLSPQNEQKITQTPAFIWIYFKESLFLQHIMTFLYYEQTTEIKEIKKD